MSTTFTVSLRSIVLTAALATTVAAAYSVGAARADSAGSAGAPSEPVSTVSTVALTAAPDSQDGIVVRGSGTASGVPDRLRFTLSTHATASDVSAALGQAAATTRKVLAALGEHAVPRRDVQTTGLSLHPVFDHSGEGPPQITGYAASQELSVLVRELPRAGDALSAVVEAGGNAVRLGGVRLQIAHPHVLLHQARARAFAEAKAKARQYAAAAGRELGTLTSVREGVSGRGSADESLALGLAAVRDLRAVPISRGSEQVTVSVSLVWAFA
jgi:uncharacterized protein